MGLYCSYALSFGTPVWSDFLSLSRDSRGWVLMNVRPWKQMCQKALAEKSGLIKIPQELLSLPNYFSPGVKWERIRWQSNQVFPDAVFFLLSEERKNFSSSAVPCHFCPDGLVSAKSLGGRLGRTWPAEEVWDKVLFFLGAFVKKRAAALTAFFGGLDMVEVTLV